jgi:hypothetical protein
MRKPHKVVAAEGQPQATLYPFTVGQAMSTKPDDSWVKGYVAYLLRGAIRAVYGGGNGH